MVPPPVRPGAARPELGRTRTSAREFEQALRFWFDRGVDGFRIDVAHSLFKDAGSARRAATSSTRSTSTRPHPYWDPDEVHDVYRSWRRIADSYDPPRVFVAEAWVPHADRLARYVRADELHTTFNFDFLRAPWRADALRTVIDATLVRARLGRRAAHVGAVQPRRGPTGVAVRPSAAGPPRPQLAPPGRRRATSSSAGGAPGRPCS